VVREYCHNTFFREDAVQEVQLALWEASALWDESQKETFNHYAWLVMRRKLLYFLTVKASERPRLSRREMCVMNALRANLAAGQMISCAALDQISKDSGITRFRLTQIVNFWYKSRISLSASCAEEIAEACADEEHQSNLAALKMLDACLAMLPEREQKIIRARYLQDPRATLASLATEMSVSLERVRQIEANSLRKLRLSLAEMLGESLYSEG
jgi:RNA polymerase sigma factor (sigma-70 family)